MKTGLWFESPGLPNKLNERSAFAQFALNMSESIGTLRLKTHLNINTHVTLHTYITHRVSQEECARLREGVPYVKVYRYNPKHLCPKLNG